MTNLASARPFLALFLAVAALACTPAPKPPTLSVHLVAAPGDFEEVNVHVREVQLEGPSGWTTLAMPDVTVNLVRLTGGVAAQLAWNAALPVGAYRSLRLVLGNAASVRLRDGSLRLLALPTALRHGLEVPVGLEARPGTAHELVVDLDAGRSVRRLPVLGGGDMFVLQPLVRSVESLAGGDRGRGAEEEG